jgi:riboflavin transporter FmnP
VSASWKQWTKNDLLFGFLVPLIVALVIVVFPLLTPFLASVNPALIGILVYGLEEQILIVAIPLFLGLLWNQWAGGASGFILGSIYALDYSHQYLLGNVSL